MMCETCWQKAGLADAGAKVDAYMDLVREHNEDCDGCLEHYHGNYSPHLEETGERDG